MSLAFLAKKSWHTANLRNVEKVWIAEQKHEAEAKKLAELRKNLEEERQLQELRQLQASNGNKAAALERVDWLYEGPMAQSGGGPSAEEYLLGKEYKPESSGDSDLRKLGDAKYGALALAKTALPANDAFSRLNEDPMMLIRKRQQEAHESVLKNPVKMGKIKATVDKLLSAKKDAKKDKKREKKEKKRKRERSSDSVDAAHERKSSRREEKSVAAAHDRTRSRSRSPLSPVGRRRDVGDERRHLSERQGPERGRDQLRQPLSERRGRSPSRSRDRRSRSRDRDHHRRGSPVRARGRSRSARRESDRRRDSRSDNDNRRRVDALSPALDAGRRRDRSRPRTGDDRHRHRSSRSHSPARPRHERRRDRSDSRHNTRDKTTGDSSGARKKPVDVEGKYGLVSRDGAVECSDIDTASLGPNAKYLELARAKRRQEDDERKQKLAKTSSGGSMRFSAEEQRRMAAQMIEDARVREEVVARRLADKTRQQGNEGDEQRQTSANPHFLKEMQDAAYLGAGGDMADRLRRNKHYIQRHADASNFLSK